MPSSQATTRTGSRPESRQFLATLNELLAIDGRLYRLTQARVPVTAQIDAETKFTGDHEHGFNTIADVQNLGPIQAADQRIRGVLGENFLAHFDVLIDYSHRLLCLDDAKQMAKYLRGERIPLVPPRDKETDLPFSPRLVVSVNLRHRNPTDPAAS